MAGEAVFAFNIAVHGDTHGLMETEVYPSVVLAILLPAANYISANDVCTLSVQCRQLCSCNANQMQYSGFIDFPSNY
jgi:hypothetical protein